MSQPTVPGLPPAELRFDDVLAARLLAQQAPQERPRLLEHLRAMRAGRAARTLLGQLVAERVLSLEQGRSIQEMVERYKRGRALGIYVEVLARAGVDRAAVQAHGRALGAGVEVDRLGAAIVAGGLLAAEAEARLRYQARVVLDRDLARQVAELRTDVPQGALIDTNAFLVATGLPPVGSGVHRLDTPIPTAPEAQAIVDRGLTRSLAAAAPRFAVPSWVDTADPDVGARRGNYTIIGRIGAGGNGIVYLCYRPDEPERPVALKVLRPKAPAYVVGRFKREIMAHALVSHPDILDVYDAGQLEGGEHFLAMEFFDGRDLGVILEQEKKLPPRRALVIARQLLSALGVCHAEGLVHRDVKPDNVLVSADFSRIKLMDFGIALLRSLGELSDRVFHTQGPSVVGTPRYMAPEQAGGDGEVGPAVDLYAMGLVLYEMLSGDFPFVSDTPSGYLACHIIEEPRPLKKVAPWTASLPDELHALIARLLAKEPVDRPGTAFECVQVIDRALPHVLG